MKQVDKNEAPEGYEAVKTTEIWQCTGCAFEFDKTCPTVPYEGNITCLNFERKDKCEVIFKAKDATK